MTYDKENAWNEQCCNIRKSANVNYNLMQSNSFGEEAKSRFKGHWMHTAA